MLREELPSTCDGADGTQELRGGAGGVVQRSTTWVRLRVSVLLFFCCFCWCCCCCCIVVMLFFLLLLERRKVSKSRWCYVCVRVCVCVCVCVCGCVRDSLPASLCQQLALLVCYFPPV
jgi:hypothetical protein